MCLKGAGMISCTLKEKYIRYISLKEKTKEARMANPMFQRWNVGDEVKFFSKRNPTMYVVVKIIKKKRYQNIRKMLEAEGIENIVPNVRSVEEGVKLYYNLPKYIELERKYGVIVFEFTLIKPHNPKCDWNRKTNNLNS